ncbi:MAG: helix-turn-helix transcriptional regulator [Bacteroidia bacterium]|nr:helix-turn-helix transcriptional regulator [Bacteroidia bacterium]
MKKLTIGEKIARMRIQKGISQKEMAGKIGMEQSGYCKLEHKGDKIAFCTVKKICNVLETDPVSLMIEHNPEQLQNDFNEVLLHIAGVAQTAIGNYKALIENYRQQHLAERSLLIGKIRELHGLK